MHSICLIEKQNLYYYYSYFPTILKLCFIMLVVGKYIILFPFFFSKILCFFTYLHMFLRFVQFPLQNFFYLYYRIFLSYTQTSFIYVCRKHLRIYGSFLIEIRLHVSFWVYTDDVRKRINDSKRPQIECIQMLFVVEMPQNFIWES